MTGYEMMKRDVLRVRLDEGAYLPQRAHDTDAGLDLRTPVDAYARDGGDAQEQERAERQGRDRVRGRH